MKKTFTSMTYNNSNYTGAPCTVNLLALPNSGYFSFEIVSTWGASIERLYKERTGVNVFGASHLAEHLSFKNTREFTTDKLMDTLRNNGRYNASTDHPRINYFYKTVSEKAPLAIKLVCNEAFNDFSRITEEEFLTERKVVSNECRQYADNQQVMFDFATLATACGLDPEDTVIGLASTVDTFTLPILKHLKSILLSAPYIVNIMYDPKKMTQDEVMGLLDEELCSYSLPTECAAGFSQHDYELANELKLIKHHHLLENPSEQSLTAVVIPVDNSELNLNREIAWAWLSQYAPTSLNELIREQNGLTYGVGLYECLMGRNHQLVFSCDVTAGTEELLMKLFKESVETTAKEFTQEKFDKLLETVKLKGVLSRMNHEAYAYWFDVYQYHPALFQRLEKTLKKDVEAAYDRLYNKLVTYEAVHTMLLDIADKVALGRYSLITNYAVATA